MILALTFLQAPARAKSPDNPAALVPSAPTQSGYLTRSMIESAINNLSNTNYKERVAAAQLLGEEDNVAAVTPLIEVLTDPEVKVRATAADSLGKIGDVKAVKPLIERLADQNPVVRAVSARSLGRLGSPRAKLSLQKRLDIEKVPVVRGQIEIALKKLDDPMNIKLDVDMPGGGF
jgi:HEAT repeat protein